MRTQNAKAARPSLKVAAVLAFLLVTLAAVPSASASVRLGLGADYWLTEQGMFSFTLSVDTPIARPLSVGGRFGGVITSSPIRPGVPLDLFLRVHMAGHRLYLEGLAGPWLFFEGDVLRAHAAVGFGLNHGNIGFGVELGWLDPRATLGVRIAFAF